MKLPLPPADWFDAAPVDDTDVPRCIDCGEPLCTDHRFACQADRREEEPET